MKNLDKEELHTIFNGISLKKEEDFKLLYEKYGRLVYAVAYSIVKHKENSEEIVQIVFEKIWKLDTEKLPNKNEASWLYAISKNEALNFLKKEKKNVCIEEIYYLGNEDKEINKFIEQDKYNRIIKRLNMQEREIVSLKVLSNLSFKDISKMLNMPIGTVQWKYYKAINTLKHVLNNLLMFIITISTFIIINIDEKKISNDMKEEIKNNAIDLGGFDIIMLLLSTVFFLNFIIFLIIFAKNQQKTYTKLSNY